ncbi:unnamed protein product [Cylindrotheca closterium]|uniref:Orc1-like AAA ATPase domain-containing protein n=1 Tax=Cylindrotheca closterium TaxID=2856 RepID=A0AAD2GCY8_9STRA|nr:unnamed protein product [Cylindrotheca closterium]
MTTSEVARFSSNGAIGTHNQTDQKIHDSKPSSSSFKTDALLSFAQVQESLANDRGLKRNKNVQELTINKLKYHSVGLVGREEEIQQLQDSISRVSKEDESRRKEIVLVKGYSGSGKSALVNRAEQFLQSKSNVVFAKGKYDQHNRDVPYAGLSSAFGEACRTLRPRLTTEETDVIGEKIVSGLGSEASLLQQIIPDVNEILPLNKRRTSDIIDPSNFGAMLERLKYSFRTLVRILSSYFSPLVLVLDDLQWSDVGSLKMLLYLMTDTKNTSPLVIIGSYRSNEVDRTHFLSSVVDDMRRVQESCNMRVSNIELDNLGLVGVNKVVVSLLDMDEDKHTRELANLCFKRTNGNPYFLLQFLSMLEEEEWLSFNLGTFKWTFSTELIEDKTVATANVVDLLRHRMAKVSDKLQLLLQYAACLGATFRIHTLEIVWRFHSSNLFPDKEDDSVAEMLLLLESEKFIETHESEPYRWVHDKVQEASMSLGKASQSTFQYEIGTVLFEKLSPEDLDMVLFNVTDLLNSGPRYDKAVPTDLNLYADLNLRAARKARSLYGAFEGAARYVRNGISFLPKESCWSMSRETTLQLYTLGAEVELALGNIEAMETYSKEVLSNEECTTMEKFPLYVVELFKLSTIDQNRSETHRFSLSILKELMGHRFVAFQSTAPLQAVLTLKKVIKLAKAKTTEQYEELQKMSDSRHEAIMKALHRFVTNCFLSKRKFLFVLGACRMITMTLDHGLSEYAGTAFTVLGQMTVRTDPKTASYFGEIALLLQQRIRPRFSEANTVYFVVSFVFPWTKQLHHCMSYSTAGIMPGLQTGNLEFSSWNLLLFNNQIPYQMGKCISSILKHCEIDLAQMKEMKQDEQITIYRLHHQLLLNLTGLSGSTKSHKGSVFDRDTFVPRTPLQCAVCDILQLDLFLFFGDLEQAADLAVRIEGNFRRTSPNYFVEMFETFHCAVALYGMARKTKKRKYKRLAIKLRHRITKWLHRGNPNVHHYVLFLQAEQAAVDGNTDTANKGFQEAVRLAGRTGHLHHAALFNERYSDFLRHNMKDGENAAFRMQEAIRFYGEWGADGVVRALSARHS